MFISIDCYLSELYSRLPVSWNLQSQKVTLATVICGMDNILKKNPWKHGTVVHIHTDTSTHKGPLCTPVTHGFTRPQINMTHTFRSHIKCSVPVCADPWARSTFPWIPWQSEGRKHTVTARHGEACVKPLSSFRKSAADLSLSLFLSLLLHPYFSLKEKAYLHLFFLSNTLFNTHDDVPEQS